MPLRGAPESPLYANASTGRVLLRANRALDAELSPTLHYLLAYVARDNVSGAQRRCFARLVLHVLPVDEFAPQFDASLPDPLPVRVSSDLPAHAIVAQVGPVTDRDRNARGSPPVLSGPAVEEVPRLRFRLENVRPTLTSCAQLFYVEPSARLHSGVVRLQQHVWNALQLFSTDLTRPEPTIECRLSVSSAEQQHSRRESSIRIAFELVLQYRNAAPPEFLQPERSHQCDLPAAFASASASSSRQDTCVFRMRTYENEAAGTAVGEVRARDPDSLAYFIHLLPAADALDVAATLGTDSDPPGAAAASASWPENSTGRVRVADSALRQLVSGAGSSQSTNALVPLFPHGVRYSIRGGSSLLSFAIDQHGMYLASTRKSQAQLLRLFDF